jgi:Tfp pilus assembly protein PilX
MPVRRLLSRLRTRLADEGGFSMIVVMIALMIGSLLSIAALAAATGDFPSARKSQDRKAAYAAAESGIQYFNFRLSQNNDYWKTCGDNGSGRITTRTVPGTTQSYTVEFLPANGASACSTSTPEATMIASGTGTFRIRATGRANGVYRSIVASYRRKSFLDYVYYTTYEVQDPASTSNPSLYTQYCVTTRSNRPSGCPEIQFADFDKVNGPLHTDDESVLVCPLGTGPIFGRASNDQIEVTGPAPGWVRNGSGCSGSPVFKGTLQTNAESLGMPASNAALASAAASDWTFTGKTTIVLNGASMNVYNASGTLIKTGWPANGILWVNDGSCSSNPAPPKTDYSESSGCGNVYVSGTYANNLTIGAASDIVVAPSAATVPSVTPATNGSVTRSGDVVLGLIANRFVRVYHPVGWSNGNCTSSNGANAMTDVTIEAAIMSVQHSFLVDNFACGAQLGTLSVTGAIAQKFRGPVGTSGGTGYSKNYNYDDRFRYRNPPFFLDPVTASWKVTRSNEQVPAARPSGL